MLLLRGLGLLAVWARRWCVASGLGCFGFDRDLLEHTKNKNANVCRVCHPSLTEAAEAQRAAARTERTDLSRGAVRSAAVLAAKGAARALIFYLH